MCPHQRPATGPRSCWPGTSATRLRSPGWRRPRPPKGRRQLLQDLRCDLHMILHLSGHRRSQACARRSTRGGQCAEDTAKGRRELERGRGCGSPVQHQMALDLHHCAGRAPAGTGLAGKPGRGHTAQDCASQGLGTAEVADRRWLYQLEARQPGVDCRWHRTQGHQPSGPGGTCHARVPH